MQNQKYPFEIRTEFNDDTIRCMFRAEYYTYENTQRLIRFVLGSLGIVAALFLNINTAGRILLMMAGVWLLVAGDFPSKVQAEGVIEKRGGKSSLVSYRFEKTGISISGGGFISYQDLDKQVFDDQYLYLFVNRQTGIMLAAEDLKPVDPEWFKTMITEHNGKEWNRLTTGVLDYNLRDVVMALDSRKKCKSNS